MFFFVEFWWLSRDVFFYDFFVQVSGSFYEFVLKIFKVDVDNLVAVYAVMQKLIADCLQNDRLSRAAYPRNDFDEVCFIKRTHHINIIFSIYKHKHSIYIYIL